MICMLCPGAIWHEVQHSSFSMGNGDFKDPEPGCFHRQGDFKEPEEGYPKETEGVSSHSREQKVKKHPQAEGGTSSAIVTR